MVLSALVFARMVLSALVFRSALALVVRTNLNKDCLYESNCQGLYKRVPCVRNHDTSDVDSTWHKFRADKCYCSGLLHGVSFANHM